MDSRADLFSLPFPVWRIVSESESSRIAENFAEQRIVFSVEIMEYVYAVILGVVQGIAEFLPISSSGHLVIAEALLKALSISEMPEWLQGMTMNVALHFGTLLSIAVVYYRDLLDLTRRPRMLLLIVVASVPVAIIGLKFKDQLESLFDSAFAAGFCLMITGVILLVARKLQGGGQELKTMPVRSAIVIGLFQAVAILPGISRAGSTVGAGLMCGLRGADAAKFSFFLAIPAIGGATLLEFLKVLRATDSTVPNWTPVVAGAVVSFVVGVFCLRWLIRILSSDRLHWFAFYCLTVGLLTVVWQW